MIYFEREDSLIGKRNAVDGVTEPQIEGRLRGYMYTYSINVTLILLFRMISNDEIKKSCSRLDR